MRFNAYSQYYDLLYKDKNYQQEADYVCNLLARYKVPGAKLLEFGSGTGIHGRLMAESGYKVTGIELSEEMVRLAETTDGFRSLHGDIRQIQLKSSFDAVVSLFHVLSYQTSNEDILNVFSNAFGHLNSGGLFVFDVWYTPAVLEQKPSNRVKRMSSENVQITRIAEPELRIDENCVDVKFTVFAKDLFSGEIDVLEEVHPMRHFSTPEIKLLAMTSGFEFVANEEFMTGNAPSEETWGVCYVLRKL